jgi:hypothetical protein
MATLDFDSCLIFACCQLSDLSGGFHFAGNPTLLLTVVLMDRSAYWTCGCVIHVH